LARQTARGLVICRCGDEEADEVVERPIIVPILEGLSKLLELLPDLPHLGVLRVEECLKRQEGREGIVSGTVRDIVALQSNEDLEEVLDARRRRRSAALEKVPVPVILQAPLYEVPVLRYLLRVARIQRRAIGAQEQCPDQFGARERNSANVEAYERLHRILVLVELVPDHAHVRRGAVTSG
jgi:hypothetical protein